MSLTESTVEDAALGWYGELRYAVARSNGGTKHDKVWLAIPPAELKTTK